MSDIYVVGGHVRQSLFRRLEEWQSCDQARILQFDLAKKESKTCLDYVSPSEVCPEDTPAILFKSAYLDGTTLYACTSTEVMVYQLPEFRRTVYISLPCFNDLHHVCPTPAGTIAIAVTGLDMVVEVTMTGQVVREWSVLGEDPWARFSKDIDYRRVATTKPHRSHPNHVFHLEGELWVTRFGQKDAICLTRPGGRIDIAVERPHDGYLFGDSLYFTTVDGHIVVADPKTLKIRQMYDLNQMHPEPRRVLGWCRGLLPLDERLIWVGFTRVRPTKLKENVAWITHGPPRHKASHIALYDLAAGKCVDEVFLEPHGIGIIFSIFRAASAG
ncbi:MAG TPA: hypothetical protein VIW68_13690 [Candidatus Sulfotelmatobacter sp.]